jgi:N-acetylglucosamine transport system permease protein
MLTEILRIAVIYIVIGSANTFALVFLVNEGEPRRHSDVLMTYLYEQAFRNGNFGYACAIGVMTLVFVVGLAALVNLLFRKESVEVWTGAIKSRGEVRARLVDTPCWSRTDCWYYFR